MKKFQKLTLIGIVAFITVLLLLLAVFSPDIFTRRLIKPCLEGSCPYRFSDDSLVVWQLTIKNGSIAPERIVVPKGRILALTVSNTDNRMHKLYELEIDGNEYTVFEEFFVKPEETKIIRGLFKGAGSPFRKRFNIREDRPGGKSYPILNTSASEVIISCTTCAGKNSQVIVSLE